MQPAPRSDLFVPGHRPERFAKAQASGADAIVLDLEDAVAAADKPAARAAIHRFVVAADAGFVHRLVVRISEAGSAAFDDDSTGFEFGLRHGF